MTRLLLAVVLVLAAFPAGAARKKPRKARPAPEAPLTDAKGKPLSGLEGARAAYAAKRFAQARELLGPLVEKHDAKAMVLMGQLHEKGEGVPQDLAKAADLYRKAAVKSDPDGRFHLAECIFHGRGEKQDEKRAVRLYEKAAEQGHARAQFIMGQLSSQGDWVNRNYAAAVTWYEKAAQQGLADAQFSLGLMYSSGIGLPQQFPHAIQWFTLAAEQGHAPAQGLLGVMYATGQGTAKDNVTACTWMTLAQDAGDKDAAAKLPELVGRMTVEEIQKCRADAAQKAKDIAAGVRTAAIKQAEAAKDPMAPAQEAYNLRRYEEAMKLAMPLAEAGHAKAAYFVGILFDRGYGVPKDPKLALKWIWRAAEENVSAAQFYMGFMSEFGMNGLPKEDLEALKWYYLAASGGDTHAADKIQELEKTLGKGPLRQGSLRAKEWRKKKGLDRPTEEVKEEADDPSLKGAGGQNGR